MNRQAFAVELNAIANVSATMELDRACTHCGRVYDEPIVANGCFSDDCPGHDLAADAGEHVIEAANYYEDMQDAEELRVLRANRAPRRMRSHY